MRAPRKTILLVEDDYNDVLLLRRAFAKAELDISLRVVNDAEQPIAYLEGREPFADREQYPTPDLVLLDLKLPCGSGHEVLAWIRRQELLKRLPVVMFTSSGEAGDVARAYDLGVNSYLVKPPKPALLLELVKLIDAYWLNRNVMPDLARSCYPLH